jgi:hypothetical protein
VIRRFETRENESHHAIQVMRDIVVGDPQDTIAFSADECATDPIVCRPGTGEMGITIDLDYQPMGMSRKIRVVPADGYLSAKMETERF